MNGGLKLGIFAVAASVGVLALGVGAMKLENQRRDHVVRTAAEHWARERGIPVKVVACLRHNFDTGPRVRCDVWTPDNVAHELTCDVTGTCILLD